MHHSREPSRPPWNRLSSRPCSRLTRPPCFRKSPLPCFPLQPRKMPRPRCKVPRLPCCRYPRCQAQSPRRGGQLASGPTTRGYPPSQPAPPLPRHHPGRPPLTPTTGRREVGRHLRHDRVRTCVNCAGQASRVLATWLATRRPFTIAYAGGRASCAAFPRCRKGISPPTWPLCTPPSAGSCATSAHPVRPLFVG